MLLRRAFPDALLAPRTATTAATMMVGNLTWLLAWADVRSQTQRCCHECVLNYSRLHTDVVLCGPTLNCHQQHCWRKCCRESSAVCMQS